MPSFSKNDTARTPFGKNQYLRSTRGLQIDHGTLSRATVPDQTIDGFTERFLQPGTVLARVTSGAEAGKLGPFRAGAVVTESVSIASTASGGTMTFTFGGLTTATVPFNATAEQVRLALTDLANLNSRDIVVTGGPLGTAPVVVTFTGLLSGQNAGDITVNTGSLTGGSATATITQGDSSGTGAATDGRQDPNNIVGILETFLPWQLKERDVEVAFAYSASVVQAACFEFGSSNTPVALTNATRDLMIARPDLSITFH